jgi:hypothetical protein
LGRGFGREVEELEGFGEVEGFGRGDIEGLEGFGGSFLAVDAAMTMRAAYSMLTSHTHTPSVVKLQMLPHPCGICLFK